MYDGLLLVSAILIASRSFAPLQVAVEVKPRVVIKAESAEQPFTYTAGMGMPRSSLEKQRVQSPEPGESQ